MLLLRMEARGALLLLFLVGAALIDVVRGDSFSDDTLCCKAYDNLLRNYVMSADCGGASTTAALATTTAASTTTPAAVTTTTVAPTTTPATPTSTTAAPTTPPPAPTTTTAFDPCASSPCQNSGTCVANGSTYTCECPALFSTPTGNNCQYFYCDYLNQHGGGNSQISLTKLNNAQGYCAVEGATTYFVIQRRQDGSVSFDRDWTNYENGFGNASGEYWFGNTYLYQLLSYTQWLLHIDLTDKMGVKTYAEYSNFIVGGPSTNYQLTSLGTYTGTAVDGMSYQLGSQFSTPDADHDNWVGNCAKDYKGGWWFNACHRGYLNGVYGSSTPSLGINWVSTDTVAFSSPGYTYSYPKASMKIRPVGA